MRVERQRHSPESGSYLFQYLPHSLDLPSLRTGATPRIGLTSVLLELRNKHSCCAVLVHKYPSVKLCILLGIRYIPLLVQRQSGIMEGIQTLGPTEPLAVITYVVEVESLNVLIKKIKIFRMHLEVMECGSDPAMTEK